jgi:hypothetical protein
MQCATHPNVETELSCGRCEKPICPKCLIHSPVGSRCRECANVRRIPTYNVSGTIFLRAAIGAVVAGLVLGAGWAFLNPITYVFFGAIAGIGIGYMIGEVVTVIANRRRGPILQGIAVGGVVLAYVVRVTLLLAVGDWGLHNLRNDALGLVVVVIAGLVAAGRAR